MRLTAKLIVLRWRVCKICEIFLSWSMMVSMTARLRVSNLSSRTTSRFFMFLRRGVISCKPRSKSCSKRGCER